jgi:hypothetical protein
MAALINIGKKLPHVPTKDKKCKKFRKCNVYNLVSFLISSKFNW